jgi:hypothetical protein
VCESHYYQDHKVRVNSWEICKRYQNLKENRFVDLFWFCEHSRCFALLIVDRHCSFGWSEWIWAAILNLCRNQTWTWEWLLHKCILGSAFLSIYRRSRAPPERHEISIKKSIQTIDSLFDCPEKIKIRTDFVSRPRSPEHKQEKHLQFHLPLSHTIAPTLNIAFSSPPTEI